MEKFSLKWNDFHSNVSKSFGLFRTEEYLHDVRLMTQDYHEVSAHRLVLSACSEYFRNIFKNSKRQDTLICLDEVTDEDLKNVLDYIYLGEAHIFQDKLDRFLSVAERLKLEGLLCKEEDETKYTDTEEPESRNIIEIENDGTETIIEEKDKTIVRNSQERRVSQDSSKKIVKTSDNGTDYNEIDLTIKEYGEILEDGNKRCTLCNKVVSGGGTTNFRNHVERYHMEGLSYDCRHCDKTFRSRGTLSNHKNRNH